MAADGDQLITGGDFSTPTVNGLLNIPGATTDFTLASQVQGTWQNANTGTMYDPGMYTVGTNPRNFHELWADFGATADDPMLFVNGFQSTNQKVLSVTVNPEPCTTGSTITYDFAANATNILPAGVASDGGANLEVKINGASIGSQDLTGVDPTNVVNFVGSVPWAPSLEVTLWNNGTAYSGNDFAIDDITLTQRGGCEPSCEVVTTGVWHNYTGKYTGTTAPALNDPKWHALPATPGGEHDVTVRGFDKPYNPGADKGKGDWFVWKNITTTCPA